MRWATWDVLLLGLTALLLAAGVVALALRLRSARAWTATDLAELYRRKTSTQPRYSGGLLVHVMSIASVERLLQAEPFVLNGNDPAIADCSLQGDATSGSCSAWTYLREDLLPMIFNTPVGVHGTASSLNTSGSGGSDADGYNTPCIGLIVDPAKLWPLISSMAVLDASTNERNCGAFYFDGGRDLTIRCQPSDRGVGQDVDVHLEGPLRGSELCRSQCEPGDDYCKYQNAGGTIAMSWLGKSAFGNFGCSDCSGPFPPEGVRGAIRGCSQSALPFLCSLDDGPEDPSTLVDPDGWAPLSKAGGYARAHVGRAGERFQRLFEDGPARALTDVWGIGGNQCKFRREHWETWIATIKRFYATWDRLYDRKSKTLKSTLEERGQNHLLACPNYYYDFLENEVNLYFNPKSADPHFAALAERQAALLRAAVVGFFAVDKTCPEQLASLEGSTCVYDGTTYHGARDRCGGWFCGPKPSSECLAEFVDGERSFLTKAAGLAQELTRKFNHAYRREAGQRPAAAFRYVGSSSSFLEPRFLERLMQGDTIPFEQVFQSM